MNHSYKPVSQCQGPHTHGTVNVVSNMTFFIIYITCVQRKQSNTSTLILKNLLLYCIQKKINKLIN